MIKVTIVTVTYNCSNVLEETIKSVINQDYPYIEYIVIDGASNDGTVDVIKKYSDRITYWISEPDCGLYDAMNKGIKIASGDYINFMNAGDTFVDNGIVSRFIPKIDRDTIVAHGDVTYIAKGYKYHAHPHGVEKVADMMPVFHQATFTKIDYHKKNLFDVKYKSAADYNFFYQAAIRDSQKYQYIPLLVANFDCCDGTSNTNYKRSHRESMIIRGVDHNFLKRMKKEVWFISVDLKKWVKKHFLSEKQIRDIEIKRLSREGKTEIIITE